MGNLEMLKSATGGAGGMDLTVMILYVVGIVAFMYFVMIRPQKKQQKAHAELMSNVAVGDMVLTSSGFIGQIIDITDDTVIIEFGNNKNCRIPMQKDAIVKVEKPGEE